MSWRIQTNSELIAHYNQDMIARKGAIEFAILLTDLFQAYQASLVAQSVIDEMNKPFEMQDTNINLGCSVGIALFPWMAHLGTIDEKCRSGHV